MLYGLHYAVFVEHQTLDRMGGSLAQGFVQAAQRDLTGAHSSIDTYTVVKFDYVRQVDVHSHWIGLAMIMIVVGAAFRWVEFSERVQTPDAQPGRAYLERRQVERDVAAEATALLTEAARNAHARLLERSVAGTVSRPHSRELTGRDDEMFLNAAYLVPRDRQAGFIRCAEAQQEAVAEEGLVIEVTGPWPPYNFVGAGPAPEAAP